MCYNNRPNLQMKITSVGDRITLLKKIAGFKKALRVQERNRVQKEFMVSRCERKDSISVLYAIVSVHVFRRPINTNVLGLVNDQLLPLL